MAEFKFNDSGLLKPRGMSEGTIKNICQSELDNLYIDNQHKLTAEVVVDSARDKESPIHPFFEWNNTKAGEEWRKQQARNMIRAVHVVKSDRESQQREYVHVRVPSNGAYYKKTTEVVEDPSELSIVVHDLAGKLEGIQRMLDNLSKTKPENRTQARLLKQLTETIHEANSITLKLQ